MTARHVSSKWKKTCILQNTSLKHYVPETRKYNSSHLALMLNRYQMIYVKPDRGTHGKGVMRVQKHSDHFELREGVATHSFPSVDQLHAKMMSRIGKRTYLIQRGIRLMTHQGRIFDLRVFVQKEHRGQWEVLSIFGRKAAKHKIVTNVSSGGAMESLQTLLRPKLNHSSIQKLRRELNQIGRSTAKHLNSSYKGLKQIGLDIALDEHMRPWILEVNTKPAIYVYRTFNPAAYRRMLRYRKA